MNEIFQLREYNNLCQACQFIFPHVLSVFNGRESVYFLGLKSLELRPSEIKQVLSWSRRKSKDGCHEEWPCGARKHYIPGVRFM